MNDETLVVWEINGQREWDATFPDFHTAWRVANHLNSCPGPGFIWVQPHGVEDELASLRERVVLLDMSKKKTYPNIEATMCHEIIRSRVADKSSLRDYERAHLIRTTEILVRKIAGEL